MYSKKVVFWSACIGMLLFGIVLITLGSIVPDLKEKLNLDEIAAGTLFSILPFGILTGSMIFGPVIDRYGYRILMALSCILLSAGFEGTAFTTSEGLLKIYVFIIGLSGGAINGATNALVSDISDTGKTANISLLGVSFGIGALGMPLILGILHQALSFEKIVAAVGVLSFLTGIIFFVIKLPPPKLAEKLPVREIMSFFRDDILILIAVFLFFQSSYEGLINNWTTSYLIGHLSIEQDLALYGLSFYVAGMVMMRLVTGTFLRNLSVKKVLFASFCFLFLGLICIKSEVSYSLALAGLMLLGAGLAGGFPVMLGFVGERYAKLSGTAFSFVLAVALLGNMLVNYGMGVISQLFGIRYLIAVTFTETLVMAILAYIILRKSGITRKL